jgi:hypothetical protein
LSTNSTFPKAEKRIENTKNGAEKY